MQTQNMVKRDKKVYLNSRFAANHRPSESAVTEEALSYHSSMRSPVAVRNFQTFQAAMHN